MAGRGRRVFVLNEVFDGSLQIVRVVDQDRVEHVRLVFGEETLQDVEVLQAGRGVGGLLLRAVLKVRGE